MVKTCPACGEESSEQARFCQACGKPIPTREATQQELRKTITVILCDLERSETPVQGSAPDPADSVLGRLQPEVMTILERHGGTLEGASRDSILAVFGIPLSREDDALRAVKAASEIKAAIDALDDGLEGSIARIVVNTGMFVGGSRTDTGVFRDAFDTAARLIGSAPPGEVLISESTYRLVRDAVVVEPFGAGGEGPDENLLAAHRLVGVSPGAVMGTLRNPTSNIVGRTGEMRFLKQFFEETVAAQSCRLVTLFGPAGVGKSRLAAEFGAWGQRSAHVLEGRCLPYGEAITFWPMAEALKAFIGIDDETTEQEAFVKIGALVPSDDQQQLICERVTAMMGLSAAAPSTQETFWAVRKLLEEVARERPLILMLDDIHWAEPTLLDLIEHIAGFSATSPIMILCQSRNELVGTRPSWGTTSEAIPVDPLTDDHVRALMDHLLGDVHLPESVSRKIRNAAEGNPLYVEEILRMLLDEGVLVQEPGGLRVEAEIQSVAIPPTIQALLAARLDRLEPNELLVLQAASVVGKTFWGGAVSDLSPEGLRSEVAHHLQGLGRKELVFPDRSTFTGEDAYRFGHILIRDATYDAMDQSHRAEMHERFALWLENKAGERLREYEEILGYHLEQAYRLKQAQGTPSGSDRELAERAWRILSTAGLRAFARTDMPAAVSLLRRASDLLPEEDPQRLELSTDLAIALGEIGEFKAAVGVLDHATEIAKTLDDEGAAGRAAIQRCLIQIQTGDSEDQDESRALATRLIPLFASLKDELGLTRAYQLLAVLDWDRYNFAATEHSLEQALAHARRAETAHDEANILTFLAAVAFWGPTPVHDAIERCEQILSSASGNHVLQAKIQLRLAGLKAMDGDFSEARRLLSRSRATLGEFGLDLELAASTQEAGLIELLAGDVEAAESEFRAGHESLAAMGEAWYLSTAAALLARALLLRGEIEEAERYADMAAGAAGGDTMYQPEWAPSKARILAGSGRHAEALSLAQETVRIANGTDDVVLQGDALMALGDVMRTSGDEDGARECFQRALELYEIKGVLPWVERTQEILRG